MNKANLFTGLLIGISTTIAGIFIFTMAYSDYNFELSLRDAYSNGYLGKLIAIGAVLNFIPFFIFIKKRKVFHARGILLACLLLAMVIAIMQVRLFY